MKAASRVLLIAREPVSLDDVLREVGRPSEAVVRPIDDVVLEVHGVERRMREVEGRQVLVIAAPPAIAAYLQDWFVFEAVIEGAASFHGLPVVHGALADFFGLDHLTLSRPDALGSVFACRVCGAPVSEPVIEVDPPRPPADFVRNGDYDRRGVWSFGAGVDWYKAADVPHVGAPGVALVNLVDVRPGQDGPSTMGCCGEVPAGEEPNYLCAAGHPIGYSWSECAFPMCVALLLDRVTRRDGDALRRLHRTPDGAWHYLPISDEPRERDLLAAIAAAPGDDAPRLVYADWLGERGHARGEHIMLRHRLASLAPEDPARAALEARAAELIQDVGAWNPR